MPYPSPVIQAAKARLSGTVQFVSGDIWRTRLADMPSWKRIFIRMLRVLLLAIRGFREDACMLRASSLTFYTMLSIVPVAVGEPLIFVTNASTTPLYVSSYAPAVTG